MAFTHIVCPTDFSDYAQHALAQAAALARWYDARLSLLHVWTASPPPMPYADAPAVLAMLPEQRDHVVAALNNLAEPYRQGGLKVATAITEGPTVPEILEYASTAKADLLVMGTHGRGGFQHLVLGSVTEKILRKAPCPVLTVPKHLDDALSTNVLYKRILCPLDVPEAANPALRYAISLAKEADAELTLLHAIEPIQPPPGLTDFDAPGYMVQLEEDWRARMAQAVDQETRGWCRLSERVVIGHAADAILRTAQELHVEAIVMGVHGRSAIDLMLFGSTTHRVVREATCPVLTVRGA